MNAGKLWIVEWERLFGEVSLQPEWVHFLLALIGTYLLVIIPTGGLVVYLDRKLSADLQARVGPNRTGPSGILQPVADFIKILQKHSERPKWRETLWMMIHTMALYSSVAVIPLGSMALLVDTEMSVFLLFWSTLVLALGTMLLGLKQGTVTGWFGGVRVVAQTLAGAFPAIVALLCVGVRVGSFRWSLIANSQGFAPWSWALASDPFQIFAFLVFVVSGVTLLAVPPLEGGQSLSDIQGGVSNHLTGVRLSLFRFGRFYGLFFWSIMAVVLFLGAWNLPQGMTEFLREMDAFRLLGFLELSWLLVKVIGLMMVVVWVARVNPRSRVDQITDFSWKVLSPFSLVALVGTSLWIAWGGWTS